MRRGASLALIIYATVVILTAAYWSVLAAGIIGVIGLAVLTVWSCCAVGAEADRAMEEYRRE